MSHATNHKISPLLCAWSICLSACILSNIAHGSTYTVEIPWHQTASLGSTGCCNYGSLGGLNGTFTTTGNCQSVYGSCIQSRRTAFWTFDLSSLPENATVLSASFQGQTEYNDQGGSATYAVKAVTGSLTTSMAMSVINSPDWQSSQYLWGGTFNIPVSASAIESARALGKLAFKHYVSTTNQVSIYNFGTNPARLVLTIEDPAGACCTLTSGCVEVSQYLCEQSGFLFLGEGTECNSTSCQQCSGDFNGNGAVDVDDLLALISVYGTEDVDHDLDGDDLISIEDLLLLLSHYGECP